MSKLMISLMAAAGIAYAGAAGAMNDTKTMSRDAYKAEKDKIEAQYKSDKDACKSQTGNAKDVSGFVLTKAPQKEQELIERALDEAEALADDMVAGKIAQAMNKLNGFKATL